MTGVPGFGFGIKELAVSLNFNHAFDQVPLLAIGQGGRDEEFNVAAFDPVACFGQGFLIHFIRASGCSQGLTIMEQCFLITFDLNNHLVAGFFSSLERFFGNGGHRR